MADGALTGVRVIELGEFISAPYCAKLLADLGADVIKLEPPGGDRARRYGPFRGGQVDEEASGLFHYLNTNKRGGVLDLGTAVGRAAFHRLAAGADIVVENLEPDALAASGATYAALTAVNPRLIVTSISAFGRSGPRAHWRGHGLQAAAGGAVAQRTGDPGRSPLSKPLNEPEFIGGLHAAAATLLALHHRERGGPGQRVDIAMQDVLFAVTGGAAIVGVVFGGRAQPRRSGHRATAFFPWTVLPVADGYMEFITMQDRHWQAFLEEIGAPAWAEDPRFQNRFTMTQYAEELEARLLAAVGGRTRADIWAACRRRGISFQPVHRIDELVQAKQLRERGYFVALPGEALADAEAPGAPYKLSGSPWSLRIPAPRLGEHMALLAGSPWQAEQQTRPAPSVQAAPRAPLAGVRVLDLGQVWAGPLLGQYLADFGAEVIRIETAKRSGMQSGAPAVPTDPANPAAYNVIMRNRRSATIDLAQPAGRDLFLHLVAVSDIVFDNMSPRAERKLGLTYEALRRANRGIIFASLSAAGQSGPWADVLTYGPSLTALYGNKSLLGYPEDGRIQEDVADLDPTAATYALVALLAALRWRERTGEGQFIDLAQGEAGLAALAEAVLEYTLNGTALGPTGNRHRTMAPHGIYPAAGEDAWLSLAVDSDAAWRAFCAVVGQPDAAADPRFATAAARLAAVEPLDALVAAWTRPYTAADLTERLQAAGVAAYPVQDILAALADPQIAARRAGVRIEAAQVEHAQIFTATPWRLSATPATIYGPARPLGADNAYVFQDVLGLSPERLAAAVAAGAVA